MAMVDLSRLESNHESRWSSSRFRRVHFYYEWLACCWELPRESLIGIMMKIGEGRVSKGRSALEVVICGVIKSGICDHNEGLARE